MEEENSESGSHSGSSEYPDEKPKVQHGPKLILRDMEKAKSGRKFSAFLEPTITANAEETSKRKGSTWLVQYGVKDIPEEQIIADAFAIDHKKWLQETYPKDSSKVYSYELDIDSLEFKSRSTSKDKITDAASGTEIATGSDKATGTDYAASTEYATAISPGPEEFKPMERDFPENEATCTKENSIVHILLEYVPSFLVQKYNVLRDGTREKKNRQSLSYKDDGAASSLPGTVSDHANPGAVSDHSNKLEGECNGETRHAEDDGGDNSVTEYFSLLSMGDSKPFLRGRSKTGVSDSSKGLSGAKSSKAEVNQRKSGQPRIGASTNAQVMQRCEILKRKFYRRGKSYPQLYKRIQQPQKRRLVKKSKPKRDAPEVRIVRRSGNSGIPISVWASFFMFLSPAKQKDLSFGTRILLGVYYIVLAVGISLFISCLKDSFIQFISNCHRDAT